MWPDRWFGLHFRWLSQIVYQELKQRQSWEVSFREGQWSKVPSRRQENKIENWQLNVTNQKSHGWKPSVDVREATLHPKILLEFKENREDQKDNVQDKGRARIPYLEWKCRQLWHEAGEQDQPTLFEQQDGIHRIKEEKQITK